MKNIKLITTGIVVVIVIVLTSLSGCQSAKEATNSKVGAQIWGENCVRCHSTPSPADYNDVDWNTIGMHMRLRGNLTAAESKKVVEFLQSAN